MRKMNLEKHTFRLRPGDVEFLRERFPNVKLNAIIRNIISREVDRLNPPLSDTELEELENE